MVILDIFGYGCQTLIQILTEIYLSNSIFLIQLAYVMISLVNSLQTSVTVLTRIDIEMLLYTSAPITVSRSLSAEYQPLFRNFGFAA